ncbi:MAG: acetate kinase [Clostridia bacterium]|nr:acetate kinase [Clostridia bacterium]MDE7329311.1 acetate kinase [Clostridia bacterium]
MKILVVNAGSSSLKYQLIEMDNEEVICKGTVECIGIEGSKITHKAAGKEYEIERPLANHTDAFNLVMECLTNSKYGSISSPKEISAIGHRVVHSGEEFDKSTYVDEVALKKLESVEHLAPLHNPASLACLKSCMSLVDCPNVVVFDTGFHSTMPDKAKLYGIPYEDYQASKIRKYGFHGTSHKFVSQEAIKYLNGKGYASDKIVTCHLGNGSSITAVKGGKCVDTSMGMTPLEGLVMGTRSGSIDPAAVEMLAKFKKMSVEEITVYLNKKSGFLGVSGVSSDFRKLCEAIAAGNNRAKLAYDMFDYQIRKFIGGYAVAMGGLDCIVFTGGIGENGSLIRGTVTQDMEFLGVNVDKKLNENAPRGALVDISAKDSKVRVLVIPTNEELVIARDTKEVVLSRR